MVNAGHFELSRNFLQRPSGFIEIAVFVLQLIPSPLLLPDFLVVVFRFWGTSNGGGRGWRDLLWGDTKTGVYAQADAPSKAMRDTQLITSLTTGGERTPASADCTNAEAGVTGVSRRQKGRMPSYSMHW